MTLKFELEHYNFFKTEARKEPLVKKGRSSGRIIVDYKKYLEKLDHYIWIEIT